MHPHCKDKMPKISNKYSQKRNIGVSVPISTFMCLRANYIFPQWVCLFCWRKYVDRSWEYINGSQTHDVEIRAEAAQFPEKEYISGIAVAVRVPIYLSFNKSAGATLLYSLSVQHHTLPSLQGQKYLPAPSLLPIFGAYK
jgi:hypothetical protein